MKTPEGKILATSEWGGLSMLISRDTRERAMINPKCCSRCGRFFDNNGRHIPAPFIVYNMQIMDCPSCYRERLGKAMQ